MGDWIRLRATDGHSLDAYRADPPEGPTSVGLVVVQEIFGVNRHIRSVCEGFAREGYHVIAPALFDRAEANVELDYTPESTPRGRALRAQIGWDAPLLDIDAAIATLRRSCGSVGAVGFCWGGSLAFLAAARLDVNAAVAYYGGQIVQFLGEALQRPVMMHFGVSDPLIVEADRAKIRAAYPDAIIHEYPSGHGFNCDEREGFDASCAALARERTIAFLADHLYRG